MYDQKYLASVAKRYAALDRSRRELQALSANILGAAKRAIFATQRGDNPGARLELRAISKHILACKKLIGGLTRLESEGMWRAALEEYAEAYMYHAAMTGKQIGRVPYLPDDPDIFLGGFCDLTGELTRSAVLAATDRKRDEVKRLVSAVRHAIAFLLKLNMTGYLRTKFDQAKQNLRKLEEIAFTLSANEKR